MRSEVPPSAPRGGLPARTQKGQKCTPRGVCPRAHRKVKMHERRARRGCRGAAARQVAYFTRNPSHRSIEALTSAGTAASPRERRHITVFAWGQVLFRAGAAPGGNVKKPGICTRRHTGGGGRPGFRPGGGGARPPPRARERATARPQPRSRSRAHKHCERKRARRRG